MTISWKDLKTKLRRELWPAGEPPNLVTSHDTYFNLAMMEISKWCNQKLLNQVRQFPACSTYINCATTVIDAPIGRIKRVYTIVNDDWCDEVFYDFTDYRELECFSRELMPNWNAPTQFMNLPKLQQGLRYHDKSADSTLGRARGGVVALHNRRLHLAPWIQSNESVVVEWDGTKDNWQDTDQVDLEVWGADAQEAIKLFVQMKHEIFWGDENRGINVFRPEWNLTLASLMREDRKQRADGVTMGCSDARCPTSAEIADDAVPAAVDELVFAYFADYGKPANGTAELDVSNLVKGWAPRAIFTGGDNIYDTDDYDAAVGAFYGEFITDNLSTNRFWPALGNHDYDDASLALFQAYFTLPNNERYYDVVKGPVHFFILNSSFPGVRDPDGISVTSKQAEWLRVKLALSTATWKVVIVQDPPYSHGGDYPGNVILRWPFKDWGASVVMSGSAHAYERMEVDGVHYIIAGTGGATLNVAPNADVGNLLTAFTKELIYGTYGAVKIIATCDDLTFEFWSREGEKLDTLVLPHG